MSEDSTYDVNSRGIMETLRKIPLFSSLGDEQLVDLGSVVTSREYGPGSVILAEGDPGDTLFLLLNGSAKVTRAAGEGREVVIAFITSGRIFRRAVNSRWAPALRQCSSAGGLSTDISQMESSAFINTPS